MENSSFMVFKKNEPVLDHPLASNNSNLSNNEDEDYSEIEVMRFKNNDVGPNIENDKNQEDEEIKTSLSKYINNNSFNKQVKWSRADDKMVDKYMKKALGYKILYNHTYFKYSWYHKIFTWPLVFFTFISLFMQVIFTTLTTDCQNGSKNQIFSIITTCITGIISILTYLQAKSSYDDLAKGCRKAGSAFSDFADDLSSLKSLPRDRRANPYQVIGSIESDYKKLIKLYSEYQIPSSVYKKFAKQHEHGNILLDIIDNANIDQFDLNDGDIEKNMIIDKFVDSLQSKRKIDTEKGLMTSSSDTNLLIPKNGKMDDV
jgi:hypothetical protein